MAARSHRSSRRPKRRTALISVAAVAVAGLAASLVIAFGPDRDSGTEASEKVGAAPAATTPRRPHPPRGTEAEAEAEGHAVEVPVPVRLEKHRAGTQVPRAHSAGARRHPAGRFRVGTACRADPSRGRLQGHRHLLRQ
ncbi:hypothetical protein F3K39_34475 [Streptomyces sp. LBUM 1479]|nr:hypothetical protein [Streptomyces sp. LBUM 1479]